MNKRHISIVIAVVLFALAATTAEHFARSPARLLQRADARAQQGEFDDAIADYRAVIAARPTVTAAHLGLAHVLDRTGKTAAAIEEYRTARTLDPENASLLVDLGVALMAQRNYTEALTVLQHAAVVRPSDPHTHIEIGAAYQRLHRIREARAEWKLAIKLDTKEDESVLAKKLLNAWKDPADAERAPGAPKAGPRK